MKAVRIFYDKQVLHDDSILELVIWKLPASEPGRPHSLKYRLYYGKDGQRIVGYDNERGKGDHRHRNDCEEPYGFDSIETLIADYIRDVKHARGES